MSKNEPKTREIANKMGKIYAKMWVFSVFCLSLYAFAGASQP